MNSYLLQMRYVYFLRSNIKYYLDQKRQMINPKIIYEIIEGEFIFNVESIVSGLLNYSKITDCDALLAISNRIDYIRHINNNLRDSFLSELGVFHVLSREL